MKARRIGDQDAKIDVICYRRSSFLRGSFLGSAAQKPGSIFSLVNRNSVDVRRNTVLGKSGSNNEQGKPDMEGWLHKQGDKYRTWNKRWFVLQGMNLYYFKSPKVSFSFHLLKQHESKTRR